MGENDAIQSQLDILTVNGLAARLKVKRSWIYGHADQLGVFRCGKYLRFSWQRVLQRLGSAVARH